MVSQLLDYIHDKQRQNEHSEIYADAQVAVCCPISTFSSMVALSNHIHCYHRFKKSRGGDGGSAAVGSKYGTH